MAVSHSVVLYEPTETSAEVVTAAGFLAGYSGRTREAYTLDLRQFIRWCDEHRLGLFEVSRTHIELYARELEEVSRAPATISRRLSTLAGFYRYATEEASSNTPRPCTCDAPSSTTSPMPSVLTATSSAPSSASVVVPTTSSGRGSVHRSTSRGGPTGLEPAIGMAWPPKETT